MSTLSAVEFITLDGVMQGFDGADDDPGFRHGGWGLTYQSPESVRAGTEGQESPRRYLMGRKTYQRMIAHWPHQPDSDLMAKGLNAAQKYVATRTLHELSWNARRLDGELVPAVEALKRDGGDPLVILGSGEIVRQLMSAGLIDRLTLFVHPLVLGSGKRMFPSLETPLRLSLERVTPTSTGVLIAEYVVG